MPILLCLVCHSIYTLYLGILNPNSFSLSFPLLFLLYAKRIMLVSCLVSVELYKNGNTNIQFGFFFPLYHRLRPSIVILWL